MTTEITPPDYDEQINNEEIVTTNSISVPSEPVEEDPDFRSMTPREKALVHKARNQEKQKLYKEMENLKKGLRDKDMSNTNNVSTVPTQNSASMNDQPTNPLLVQLADEVKALRAENAERERLSNERARLSELKAYRSQKLLEAREAGIQVIEALVQGDSEEDIDNNFNIAKAEYLYVEDNVRKKLIAEQQANGTTPITVVTSNGRPAGVAQVMSGPGAVVEESPISAEFIRDTTTDAAVRNGDYAKNRSELLARVKRTVRYTGNAT